jgi:hypothetical protein
MGFSNTLQSMGRSDGIPPIPMPPQSGIAPPPSVPGIAPPLPQYINQSFTRPLIGHNDPFQMNPSLRLSDINGQPCNCGNCTAAGLGMAHGRCLPPQPFPPPPMLVGVPGNVNGSFGQGVPPFNYQNLPSVSASHNPIYPMQGSQLPGPGAPLRQNCLGNDRPLGPLRGPPMMCQPASSDLARLHGDHVNFRHGDVVNVGTGKPIYMNGQSQGQFPLCPVYPLRNQLGGQMGINSVPLVNQPFPLVAPPQTSAGPIPGPPVFMTPPSSSGSDAERAPAIHSPIIQNPTVDAPLPAGTSSLAEEAELSTMLGYFNIGSNNDAPEAASSTPNLLRDISQDLAPLAMQISSTSQPFDTVAQTIPKVLNKFGLSYPHEWRLSLRTYSCISPGNI